MSFNYLWTLKEATERMYQSFKYDIKNQWEKTDWRILKERDKNIFQLKLKKELEILSMVLLVINVVIINTMMNN